LTDWKTRRKDRRSTSAKEAEKNRDSEREKWRERRKLKGTYNDSKNKRIKGRKITRMRERKNGTNKRGSR
jgi:hypothetical protein